MSHAEQQMIDSQPHDNVKQNNNET